MDRLFWYGDKHSRVLVSESGGDVLALVRDDGHGRYALTLYLSIFSRTFWSFWWDEITMSWRLREYADARQQWWRHLSHLSWRSFPRPRLLWGDLKHHVNIDEACVAAEEMAGPWAPTWLTETVPVPHCYGSADD